jgi:hypothetical protein
VGRGAQQEKTEGQDQQPGVINGPAASGVTVNVLGPESSQKPDPNCCTSNQDPPSDWRNWLPNWIIALFALVAALVANEQRRWVKRQAVIMDTQAKAAEAAGKAAAENADSAKKMLLLSATTYLDLKGHGVTLHRASVANVPTSVTVKYGLANVSNNVARNVSVNLRFGVNDAMNFAGNAAFTAIAPTKRFFLPMNINALTPDEQQALNENRARIRVQITARWTDPLGRESMNSFHRVLTPPIPGSTDWVSNSLIGGMDEAHRDDG